MPATLPDRSSILREMPRWYLLALLIWAPWCYGSTRPWTADLLGLLMSILGVFWLVYVFVERKSPRIPFPLAACVGILLLQGWWMIANADHHYNRNEFRFEPVTPLVSWLPGAFDTVQAIPTMLRYTGIFAVFLFTADLVQRPVWRNRLLWTMGSAGISIIIFGIFWKILGLGLTSTFTLDTSKTSFSTFYYHGNAGAFVNLVLPFIWTLAILSWRKDEKIGRAIWIPAVLLCVGAAAVIASKAAMIISGLLLLGLLVSEFRHQLQRQTISGRGALLYATLTMAAIGAAVAFGWSAAAGRWAEVAGSPHLATIRLVVYRVCLKILPDSSWWGFGPGNFNIAFPHYTVGLDNVISGFWTFAHEDYLQTLIEWGWFGAFFWSVILLGAIISGMVTLRRKSLPSSDRSFVLAALFALLGVAVHAAVDFPLQIASLQLYAAVSTGILWGSRNIAVQPRSTSSGRPIDQ